MAKQQSEYDRIVEVRKRLSKRGWIKRYASDDESIAQTKLALQFGFEGRVGYMIELCNLLNRQADREGFEGALRKAHEHQAQVWIARLADDEVEVEATLSKGTDPSKVYFGECFTKSFQYFLRTAPRDSLLAHGMILVDRDTDLMTMHAWVEMTGGVLFDGVMQRFYDKEKYYKRHLVDSVVRYDFEQAVIASSRQMHYGPWHI